MENLEQVWININKEFIKTEGSGAYKKDKRGGAFLHLSSRMIEVPSSKINLCLEEIGYSDKKILHLIRTYIDPQLFKEWVYKISQTLLKFGVIESDYFLNTGYKSKHGHGPCLIGMGFKTVPLNRLTIYFRSLEFPQKSLADFLLISAICRYLEGKFGDKVEILLFISDLWMKATIARFYLIYKYPEDIEYSDEVFNKDVQKGWNSYILGTKNRPSLSINHRLSFLMPKGPDW